MSVPSDIAAFLFRPREFFSARRQIGNLKYYFSAFALLIGFFQTKGLTKGVGFIVLGAFADAGVLFVSLFAITVVSQVIGRVLFGIGGDLWDTLRVYLCWSVSVMALFLFSFLAILVAPHLWSLIGTARLVAIVYLWHVASTGLSAAHNVSMPKAYATGLISLLWPMNIPLMLGLTLNVILLL